MSSSQPAPTQPAPAKIGVVASFLLGLILILPGFWSLMVFFLVPSTIWEDWDMTLSSLASILGTVVGGILWYGCYLLIVQISVG